MMRAALATVWLSVAVALPAAAQVSPFDMSPERPASPAAPVAPAAPIAPAPPLPAPPLAAPDPAQSAPSKTDPAVVESPLAQPPQPASAAASAQPTKRFLIPFSEFVLSGEYASNSWSINVTPEQAASKTTLNIGYQNAIIVAPEISRLRLSINGSRLIDAPISSPDRASALVAEVPAGLLHAGMNDLSIEAVQRHRTDCTMESTYELWTELKPAETFLTFQSADSMHWTRYEDLRAIGVDGAGSTTFNLIVPSMRQSTTTPLVIRLAESLALTTNMPNQSFKVSETLSSPASTGQANVIMGIASELAGMLAILPTGAESSPTVAFIDDPKSGPSTLVVTGPTWQMVETAVEGLAHQVDRPIGLQRTSLASMLWRSPDVPLLVGATQLKLSDLGVATVESSGRRLRTDFAVGVPADFYANAYGEATILLDAAYSEEVLPGSHIDIYVNDNIAATVPITASGGEILRHLPIKVTMRHFRPGENVIAIEAVLRTEADQLCAPGATALDKGRFVLFDSSEFVMPDYARIGRMPDLASLAGTAFPYNRVAYPIPLIIDRTQPDSLSASATLMARMAVAAGRLIPVDTAASVASIADKDAIFLSTISQVPPAVLAQVGVSDDSRANWGETVASIKPDTQATFDEWRERLRGSGWRGQVSLFEEWVNRTFNVSMDTFRVFRSEAPVFMPGGNVSLLLASNINPGGTGNWMLVAAPTVGALKDGVDELASRAGWPQLGGHISTLDPESNAVSSIPAEDFQFVETQPFSWRNYRLIAANWLSSNTLSYGLALIVLSISLGLATAGLLGTFGRKH